MHFAFKIVNFMCVKIRKLSKSTPIWFNYCLNMYGIIEKIVVEASINPLFIVHKLFK